VLNELPFTALCNHHQWSNVIFLALFKTPRISSKNLFASSLPFSTEIFSGVEFFFVGQVNKHSFI
jgi:hypothetical protein